MEKAAIETEELEWDRLQVVPERGSDGSYTVADSRLDGAARDMSTRLLHWPWFRDNLL
jgi:hypothetical protein